MKIISFKFKSKQPCFIHSNKNRHGCRIRFFFFIRNLHQLDPPIIPAGVDHFKSTPLSFSIVFPNNALNLSWKCIWILQYKYQSCVLWIRYFVSDFCMLLYTTFWLIWNYQVWLQSCQCTLKRNSQTQS